MGRTITIGNGAKPNPASVKHMSTPRGRARRKPCNCGR